MANNGGSGLSTGLLAGILLVVLIAVGLFLIYRGYNLGGGKDVNVNVEAPKIDAPDLPEGGNQGE